MKPDKTKLLRGLAQVPRPAGVVQFVEELLKGFNGTDQPQSQQTEFDEITANTILIGDKGRIRALPNGIVIEMLGMDGVWKEVIKAVQDAPTVTPSVSAPH
jgi:hypothetical protein